MRELEITQRMSRNHGNNLGYVRVANSEKNNRISPRNRPVQRIMIKGYNNR